MATAAIVALRRRQEMDGGAETAEPLLVGDGALRRLVRVQATFRGARSRRKVQQQQRWHAGASSGVVRMVPVRAAARVIRESAVRRHGNRALLLYIVFLMLFAAMLLHGSNQEGAFMLKDGVKRRLGAVKTKDGRTYSECLTLEDIGYWVPAAAASLTSVSDSELSSMNSLSPEQMAALVAGGSMPPSPSGLGAAPAPPGGRPAATTNLTGNLVTGAKTMLLTADDGSVYLPPIGLVMQYNRIVPTLQIRTRRRRVSYGGCGSAGGGDGWLRTCWYDDDDASPWVGSVTNTTYVQSNGAFGFDWPLGFPPMPPGLQNTRWLALMQDGWLGDRTLDVEVSMIFLNTNTNLIGMATLTWTMHLSGAITSEVRKLAITLSWDRYYIRCVDTELLGRGVSYMAAHQLRRSPLAQADESQCAVVDVPAAAERARAAPLELVGADQGVARPRPVLVPPTPDGANTGLVRAQLRRQDTGAVTEIRRRDARWRALPHHRGDGCPDNR